MLTTNITRLMMNLYQYKIINMKNNQKYSFFNYFSNISNLLLILEKQLKEGKSIAIVLAIHYQYNQLF